MVAWPTAANVEFYADIVMEKAMYRALITAGTKIAAMGFDGAGEAPALLDEAERLVFTIGQRREHQDVAAIRDVLRATFEAIDKRQQQPGHVTGLATGFSDLDRLTSGLQPQDMVIVAARPSMGKSTFCAEIAASAALIHKVPVAIFSLETSKEQLVQRILSAEARVDNTKLRTGYLSGDDWRKLARAIGGLSEAPLFIDDSPALSVMEMRAKGRKLKAEHGLGLIVLS